MHDLRSRWAGSRVGPSRARADLSPTRLGGARSGRDLGPDAGGHSGGAGQCGHRRVGPRECGHHQPTRNRGGVGPIGNAGHKRDRLAGHPDRRHRGSSRRYRWARSFSVTDRATSRHVFRRTEGHLDAGERRWAGRSGRSGGVALWNHRLLGHVEPHRGPGRWTSRHRCHERVSHPHDGPRHTRLGSGPGLGDEHPRLDAPRDRAIDRADRTWDGRGRRCTAVRHSR